MCAKHNISIDTDFITRVNMKKKALRQLFLQNNPATIMQSNVLIMNRLY
jgi:hypothetical protein